MNKSPHPELVDTRGGKWFVLTFVLLILLCLSAFGTSYVTTRNARIDLELERKVALELKQDLQCRAQIATEVDVIRIKNDIAYDNYVLALGQKDTLSIPAAQEAIAQARDELKLIQAKREKTSELCAR